MYQKNFLLKINVILYHFRWMLVKFVATKLSIVLSLGLKINLIPFEMTFVP